MLLFVHSLLPTAVSFLADGVSACYEVAPATLPTSQRIMARYYPEPVHRRLQQPHCFLLLLFSPFPPLIMPPVKTAETPENYLSHLRAELEADNNGWNILAYQDPLNRTRQQRPASVRRRAHVSTRNGSFQHISPCLSILHRR